MSSTQINEIVIRAGIDPGNALKLDSLRAQKMECDEATQRCVSRLQFDNQVRGDQLLPGKENGLQAYFIVFDEEAVATQAVEVIPGSMGKK